MSRQLQVYTREKWWDVTDIRWTEDNLLAVGYTNGSIYVNFLSALRFQEKDSEEEK